MKKKWSLLAIFCLSAIMLAACNENTVEEDVKEEVQIEGQNEVKKEQEMTLDEGRTIVTDLYNKIIDELVTYGEQQGIEGEENITDTQVAEVMEKFKNNSLEWTIRCF